MPGGTTISAVAILSNPRPFDVNRGTKNLLFDVNLWVTDNYKTESLGLFRYFNDKEVKFDDKATRAFVTVHLSKFDVNIPDELRSEGLDANDYAYLGDIIKLIVISKPKAVDLRQNPQVVAYGTVLEADHNDDVFKIDAEQYSTIAKKTVNCPIRCFFLDSPRWGDHKPKPQVDGYVVVTGTLDSVKRTDHGVVSHFELTVESVTFLGRAAVTVHKKRSAPTAGTSTKRARLYDELESAEDDSRKTEDIPESHANAVAGKSSAQAQIQPIETSDHASDNSNVRKSSRRGEKSQN